MTSSTGMLHFDYNQSISTRSTFFFAFLLVGFPILKTELEVVIFAKNTRLMLKKKKIKWDFMTFLIDVDMKNYFSLSLEKNMPSKQRILLLIKL
jgi:hypothetical protein